MASVTRTRIGVDVKVTLELNESEVRALDGIFGYNVDHFLKCFYEKCGKAYVQPHEAGVRSLHETIRGVLSAPLAQIDKCRRGMHDALATKPTTGETSPG
jgi:hypothetical protein